VCILIRENIKYEIITFKDVNHPSVEYLAIKAFCLNMDIIIVNIYRHFGQNTPIFFFKSLLNELQHCKNYLILGDFNAHHIA